jgi:glycosyltransferase involved in cell wall biosynthesis
MTSGMARERAITVSLPYFRCRPYLRRAVESILGQTHGDLTLIVLNDGDETEPWDLLADIKDDRLVRFDLDSNRGRYFADAVALIATQDQYFMVQDADDWSSPSRAEKTYEALRENRADAAFCAVTEYRPRRRVTRSYAKCTEPPPPQLTDVAKYPAGIYRTHALRTVGCYAGFRIGYDTLLLGLLSMSGRIAYVAEPLYNRSFRAESLTSSPHTGRDSAARRIAQAQLEALYDRAYLGFREYVGGRIGLTDLGRLTAQVARAHVTAQDVHVLRLQAARLRRQLPSRAPARQVRPRWLASWSSLSQLPGDVAVSTLPADASRRDVHVSVVLPGHIHAAALPGTIRSFLSMRSRDTRVEFVVVDGDDPQDADLAPFARLFDLKAENASLTVVRHRSPAGIPWVRNLGARYASGERLFLTDARAHVGTGWDAMVADYGGSRRVLAATIVDDETGARGFGASLRLPELTVGWNPQAQPGPAAVQVAASAGMVIARDLYWSIGGFDPGMIMPGSADAEFSLRAWLSGAEVLNVPGLTVRCRAHGAAEPSQALPKPSEALPASLHTALHDRLRFAVLYLPSDLVLRLLSDMAASYPEAAVAQACSLLAVSDVWRRRSTLREHELLSFGWFLRRFGLELNPEA